MTCNYFLCWKQKKESLKQVVLWVKKNFRSIFPEERNHKTEPNNHSASDVLERFRAVIFWRPGMIYCHFGSIFICIRNMLRFLGILFLRWSFFPHHDICLFKRDKSFRFLYQSSTKNSSISVLIHEKHGKRRSFFFLLKNIV